MLVRWKARRTADVVSYILCIAKVGVDTRMSRLSPVLELDTNDRAEELGTKVRECLDFISRASVCGSYDLNPHPASCTDCVSPRPSC